MHSWPSLHRLSSVALVVILLLAFARSQMGPADSLRGEKVGWARLKTPNPWWRTHANTDPKLMQFFRQQTTLNIDPTWYYADVEDLKTMSAYPLLFCQSLAMVRSSTGRKNLAEYVRRGGFLLIDACINPFSRGNPDQFITDQEQVLSTELPEARYVLLPNDHELYRCFYKFPAGPPHTEEHEGWGDHGFYGVYLGSRMIGVISTSGLQCGWAGMKQSTAHENRCMMMLVNIYLYAMLQTGSSS